MNSKTRFFSGFLTIDLMKFSLYFRIIFLIVSAMAVAPAYGQVETAPPQSLQELQERLRALHQQRFSSAWAIALIENGERVWLEVNGKSNLEEDIDATEQTLFRIGSTSKILVAMAALKLVEQGRLQLDTPLRDLAPEIEFNNPWEDTDPVRFEHLIEHTSGWDDMHIKEYVHNDPNAIPLREALTLFPGSRHSRWVPGTRQAYCNTGPAVAAYVIEKIVGQDFEEFVAEQLFQSLQMQDATYRKPEDYEKRAAIPYFQGKQEFWHVIYRPSGSVSASIISMSNLLELLINDGLFHGQQILNKTSITRMRTPETTTGYRAGIRTGYSFGLAIKGHAGLYIPWYGHDGFIWGAHSHLFFAPELNSGYVMLSTGTGAANSDAVELIRGYLSRHRTAPEIESNSLPESYKNLDGYYIGINPRSEAQKLQHHLVGVRKVQSYDNKIEINALLENWIATLYFIDGKFVNPWIGIDDLKLVEDPLDGQLLQLGGESLKRVPVWSLFGRLAIVVGTALVSTIVLIWVMVWISQAWVNKLWASPKYIIWYAPSLASLGFLYFMLVRLVSAASIESLAAPSFISVSLIVGKMLFFTGSVMAVAILFIYAWSGLRSISWWLASIVCLFQVSCILLLHHYGMLISVSWNS